MRTGKKTARNALRAALLASVALAAQPAHAQLLGLTVLEPPTAPTGGAVQSYYGRIGAFYGKIGAFYGKIGAFWGDISPYYGKIGAFYGKIGAFQGQNDPFWGDPALFASTLGAHTAGVPLDYTGIGSFWNGVAGQWGSLSQTWAGLDAAGNAKASDYAGIAAQLKTIVGQSQTFWGPAVTFRTGQSFDAGFTQPLLARYGVNLDDPSTLQALTPEQRALFIMSWYDGLMEFTGTDHVDHWMKEANWTPAVTQIQGEGSHSVIGLLDFTVKDAPDIQAQIIKSGGISDFSIGHGAAVASLMVSAHDGSGVMGIAPNASVVQYNPFDATATANWNDIDTGIKMLVANNASVINASLGVPGYTLSPDWNGALLNLPALLKRQTALVIAAGNDGSSQTKNVEWNPLNMPFIVVGSVDPDLNISSFSNRPGTACLTLASLCLGDYLQNHFLVAPGEMMLVSDDHGGFTRMSGTSFAAPLVSGAIALLQDRWPWLTKDPADTVYILLHSAKDLGAPGPDPVYGMGLLDVTASQSPLNYNKLSWYQSTNGSRPTATTAAALRDPKQQSSWEANGVYVYAYETLPNGGYRDFAIPLSSKLVGQAGITPAGQREQLQNFLTSSFKTWTATPSSSGGGLLGGLLGFSGQPSYDLGQIGPMELSLQMQPVADDIGWRAGQSPYSSHFVVSAPESRVDAQFGYGEGGQRLSGSSGMFLRSDYNALRGGANPFLGLASGGAYGGVNLTLAPGLRFSVGATTRDSRRDLTGLGLADWRASNAVEHYRASAYRTGLTWRLAGPLQLNGGFTSLTENTGVLGEQSTDQHDLAGGSVTQAFDVGADLRLRYGWTASFTASQGRTRTPDGQNLKVIGSGLSTSSYAVALTRTGVFGAADRLRLSLSQPMFVERGQMSFTGVEVVDRQTGEMGSVTHTFGVAQSERPLVAELLYARPIMKGAGSLGVFGRAENQGLDLEGHASKVLMTGMTLGFHF